MTGIIKSLLGKKRQPAPEEIEALDRATKVLQWRVAQMTKTIVIRDSCRAAA